MPYKPTPKDAKWTRLTVPIQAFQSARLEITTTDSQKSYIAEVSIQPKSPGANEPAVTVVIPYVGKNLWDLSNHVVNFPPQAIEQFEKTLTLEGEARYRIQLPESKIFSESPAPPQWPRLITG